MLWGGGGGVLILVLPARRPETPDLNVCTKKSTTSGEGSRFRVSGSGFRVQGLGFKILGSPFRALASLEWNEAYAPVTSNGRRARSQKKAK